MHKIEMTYKGYPVDFEKIIVTLNSDGTKTVIIPDINGNIISIETMSDNCHNIRPITLKVELK